jgi:acetyltransferase
MIALALSQGRELLTEPEAKGVLASYAIPVVATRVARDADEAARHAHEIGFPIALKIHSPDISHKSDVGGVKLNIASAA